MERKLENIPENDLKQVVDDFISEGWTVEKTKNSDGTWTVVAKKN